MEKVGSRIASVRRTLVSMYAEANVCTNGWRRVGSRAARALDHGVVVQRRASYPRPWLRAGALPLALVLSFSGLLPLVVSTSASATSPTFSNAVPATYGVGVHDEGYDPITIHSISCSSAGDCSAVGSVSLNNGNAQSGVLVSSTNGTWGSPQLATFASGVAYSSPSDVFYAISCSSAGDCTAAGQFLDANGHYEAMTETSSNGVWANAVPAAFVSGVDYFSPYDVFNAISCSSPGDCTAAGQFLDDNGDYEAMTETSTNGVWANAVPATFVSSVDNANPNDVFYAISCSSPGDCTAAGQFEDANGYYEAMTETSSNGAWANVAPATFGTNVAYSTPNGRFNAISCSSPGDCTAAGQFLNAVGNQEAMTETSTNGTWTDAVPATFGTNVANSTPDDLFDAISCSSAGDCTAAGQFFGADSSFQAMTETSSNGVWANAVPATYNSGVQNQYPGDIFYAISCSSAGDCTAAGNFRDAGGNDEAMTETSTNGVWAIAVPATYNSGVHSTSPDDAFYAISCSSAGDCTAAGDFASLNRDDEAMVQTSTLGTWSNAVGITYGTIHFEDSSGQETFDAISCSSAGDCTAAGDFEDADGNDEAMTETSTNGVWANAVPATFASGVDNANPSDRFYAISCSSPGDCTAAGYFADAAGHYEAMTETSTNGVWTDAAPATFVSGVDNTSPDDAFYAISCSSPGDCTAAGDFKDANDHYEAMTETSTNGVWANAVPATFASSVDNANPNDVFYAISCSAAGDCTAAGYFEDANGYNEAMTETSTNGVWAIAVPAAYSSGVHNTNADDAFYAVSCSSPGDCTAAGYFEDANGNIEAMTETSTDGVWAIAVPATYSSGVHNTNADDEFYAISCSSPGDCTAAGYFAPANGFGNIEAMTETSTNGVWANAVPATFASGVDDSAPNDLFHAISCWSPGDCTAAGNFRDANGNNEAMTETSTNGVWANSVPATFASGVDDSAPNDAFSAISCTSATNCAAVGKFDDANGDFEAMTESAFTTPATTTSTSSPATTTTTMSTSSPATTFAARTIPAFTLKAGSGIFTKKAVTVPIECFSALCRGRARLYETVIEQKTETKFVDGKKVVEVVRVAKKLVLAIGTYRDSVGQTINLPLKATPSGLKILAGATKKSPFVGKVTTTVLSGKTVVTTFVVK